MNITLIITLLTIISIVGLVATLLIGRQETKRIKQYEEEGDTAIDELKRSREYEKKSLKSNLPILSAIYIVFILGSIIALVIYIF
ncbi:hypothetical protein [Saliterribacillus persicus]|uniref:Uncharacterized protein n=1 Tax=Saliterribacillus persicus TaxID=930114 RepID=A0A368YAE2_9BACI|nr:hypothetical protein [Saliterribacillus persicus]RCW77172.1 hypothetical protein DFR57_10139 [Saliterribacillus persicus]